MNLLYNNMVSYIKKFGGNFSFDSIIDEFKNLKK